jgi:hypothetical protein
MRHSGTWHPRPAEGRADSIATATGPAADATSRRVLAAMTPTPLTVFSLVLKRAEAVHVGTLWLQQSARKFFRACAHNRRARTIISRASSHYHQTPPACAETPTRPGGFE